jgi:hypothetical protein
MYPTQQHRRPSRLNTQANKAVDANRATLSYCYTALLFFIALLVTWVPSSINRVYTLVSDTGKPSPFGLDFASSLVLPLQGFWNLVIYVVTSWGACTALWDERIVSRLRRPDRSNGFEEDEDLKMASLREGGRGKGPRDPYPLSPHTSVGSGWPLKNREESDEYATRPREVVDNNDAASERADIVMSLDAHGRVVRQGRARVDWLDANSDGQRSPISALPSIASQQETLVGSDAGKRGSRRSWGSGWGQGHSRQGSGRTGHSVGGRQNDR